MFSYYHTTVVRMSYCFHLCKFLSTPTAGNIQTRDVILNIHEVLSWDTSNSSTRIPSISPNFWGHLALFCISCENSKRILIHIIIMMNNLSCFLECLIFILRLLYRFSVHLEPLGRHKMS